MKKHALRLPVIRVVAVVLGLCGLSAAMRAETLASPWVEGYNNKVRLIAGRASLRGMVPAAALVGVEIVMPSGWKTYWRNPGEAGGVPPEFDWSGSENLGHVYIAYPAPHRFSDKSGQTIGYKEHVIFPAWIYQTDLSKPVKLKLKASYGACKELCVPAEAALELNVPGTLGASAELDEVASTVPELDYGDVPPAGKFAFADPKKDPRLKTSRVDDASGKPKLVLEVTDPGVTGGDAFLYSPEGLYLPLPKKISEANGSAVYEADLSDGVDFKALKAKGVGVVLTGAKGQSETIIQIP